MATVSSIDNQRPFLPQSGDSSSKPESESILPFGEWLEQNSDIKDEPQPIRFKEQKQSAEADPVNEEDPQGTKLFAQAPAEKTKQSKSLFKEKPAKPEAGANKASANGVNEKPAQTNEKKASEGPKTEPIQHNNIDKGIALKVSSAKTELVKSTAALKTAKQAAADQKASTNQNIAKTIQSTPVENLKSTKPVPSQPNQVESMAQLKTNVKAIFNSLSPLKTSAPSDTSSVRVSSQVSHNASIVSMDKVKPIRLTQATLAKKGSKPDGTTTIHHLKARKSAQLDPAISSVEKKATPSTNVEPQTETGVNKLTTKAQAAGVNVQDTDKKGNRIVLAEDSKIAKGRKRTKAKASKLAAQQRNQLQHAVPDGTSNTSRQVDTTVESNQLQNSISQLSTSESMQTDQSSADANSNNLFGRSESGANVSTGKQSGKTAQAYASRSLSWLRALSDKTSQINRQDPNWKMLEMKLDKGDGEMTIKVMRKDDQVSVSVQFTDDALRAQTESQANQILESLKEHYGEDVNFSFADKKESSMDSSLDRQAARRRRLRGQTEQAEKPVQANPYNDQGPDQHVWIG